MQEGVELFDEIWEKVYGAQNQNQKEKFESELKSQIKKLQRYRDDIKTWITNSDIKDKRPLTDARKLIETEMERFKVCEKEFKTKAFSKEGLASAPKEDPKEKDRNRVRKWVGTALETLSERKDVYEAELETINSAKKKKKDTGAQKWEDLLERCRYHEDRLELILRLIDNESLTPEEVDGCKDQLDYLLESMTEGDYDAVDGIDDDGIYEELGLEEHMGKEDDEDGGGSSKPEPAKPEKAADKTPDKKKSKADKEEEERKEKERKEKEKKKEAAAVTELPSINAAALKAKPLPKSEPPVIGKPLKEPASASPKTPTPTAGGATTAAAAAASLPGATTAAAATRGKAAAVPLTVAAATVRGRPDAPAAPAAAVVSGRGGLPMSAAGRDQSTAAAALAGLGAKGAAAGPAGLPAPGTNSSANAGGGRAAADVVGGFSAAAGGLLPPAGRGGMGALGLGSDVPLGGGLPVPGGKEEANASLAGLGGSDHSEAELGVGSHGSGLHSLVPGGAGAPARGGAPASVGGPPIEGDDLSEFEELIALGATPTGGLAEDAAHTRSLLALSLLNMPEPADSERPRTYVPRNPYPTPNSFPQTPAPVFDSPSTFDKFDTDTLFFIFYYQQGTYQQFLAARELKRQSWRYHKKYLTWFQRHEEPKVTAEDYEQGTYVYFDYETGWCQRIKADFTFEYGFLEDEMQS